MRNDFELEFDFCFSEFEKEREMRIFERVERMREF
jgi:hypothetical protein